MYSSSIFSSATYSTYQRKQPSVPSLLTIQLTNLETSILGCLGLIQPETQYIAVWKSFPNKLKRNMGKAILNFSGSEIRRSSTCVTGCPGSGEIDSVTWEHQGYVTSRFSHVLCYRMRQLWNFSRCAELEDNLKPWEEVEKRAKENRGKNRTLFACLFVCSEVGSRSWVRDTVAWLLIARVRNKPVSQL